jgi:AraC-like DNA-binding protein
MERNRGKTAEKKAEETKRKVGRPKKRISQKQFEELCGIQCTREEICAVLDVSEKTLNEWCRETYGKNFSLIFDEKREAGKMSLRRKQWNLAETNATMGIWLGKQYLGQRDETKVDISSETGVGVQIYLPNNGRPNTEKN